MRPVSTWDEVNPGRSHFGHSIIYSTCLHETGMKNAQTGLKSSRPLDRADYLHTGTDPGRDECERKYVSDRSQLPSLLQNNACSTKPCIKKTTMAGKRNKSKDLSFSYRSHVTYADNFAHFAHVNMLTTILRPRSHGDAGTKLCR